MSMVIENNIQIEELQGDTAYIEEKIRTSSEPFIVTKEGHPIAVLQSITGYQNLQKAILMLKILSLGESDIRENRVRDQKEVFESLIKKIGCQHE